MQIKIKSTVVFSLATLALTACGGGGTDYVFNPAPVVKVSPAPAFSPADGGPTTNNLLFSGTTDGTLNIPNPDDNPLIAAINTLDGFSTTNPIVTSFSTPLDPASLAIGSSIRVFQVSTTAQGVVTKVTRELGQQEILVKTIDPANKTLALIPLRPLKESTTYMVVLTRGIKDAEGTPVNSSGTYLLLKGPIIPVSAGTPAQVAQLKALRPLVNAMETAASDDAVSNKVAKDSIVLSWAFTTQSITPVLDKLAENAAASDITLVNTGLTPHDANPLLPGVSEDIYIGTLKVPYYLKAPDANDPTAALTSSWKGIGGSNLTRFNPTAVATSDLTIPVIMTIPKETNTRKKPASGWPIVMYQHGITRVRTDMLIYADNLAQAGFAMIAIDLPMHGITDPANPFNAKNTAFPTDRELTFDMDFVNNNTGATGPDGKIDDSGTHFINLGSLLTSRDNVRQGVSDLLTLRESLVNIPDIDASKVGFIAHSLGGLVGTTYLGVETKPLPTSLVTTGGGILGIIDKSATIGPRVRAGLAANGVTGASYQRFLIAAQSIVDSADPINFAQSAAAVHPIHMIEVIGDGTANNLPDQTIPNLVPPLAGTEPLAALMGLKTISKTTAGIAPTKGGIVRITQGEHASILRPSKDGGNNLTYLNVFTEMHREVTAFQATGGTTIVVTDESIVK